MQFNERTKPKFQPWNDEEFCSDVHVRSMSALPRWMFRSLLQSSFYCTSRPYLPNDDQILWVLAGCDSLQQWLENKEVVLRRFSPVEDHPELLEHKRVSQDWSTVMISRERFSKMGEKSAQARSNSGSTNGNVGSTYVKRKSNLRATREVKVSEVEGSVVKGSEGSKPLAAAASANTNSPAPATPNGSGPRRASMSGVGEND